MVLASMYENRNRRRHIAQGREQGRAEGFEQGRAEGLAEAHSVWRDWLRRRDAAAASDQTFDEPMPGTKGSNRSAILPHQP